MGLSGVEETDPSGILARAAVTMYELMSVLKEAGLTNHLPHALVRIHHLQKMMKGVEMKDMAPLIMASPELVKIMNVAHEDPGHMEEVRISNFHVPWDSDTEISSIDDIIARRDDPGPSVLSRPGSTQINSNIVKEVEKTVGMQACPTHGMDHGIADPECVACK
eukprot:505394-Amphidinium_carterae.2